MNPRGARHLTLVLVLACLAQFMVILDLSIVNIALPSIRADLHFSATGTQWVVNAYAIVFAGFLMLGGRTADIIGQRKVYVAGMLVFAFASLAGGLAGSSGLLVAARAVQGLGAAIIAPSSLAIITTTFKEGPERNRAVGLWGAMGGAGGATGTMLSGVITQGLTWRWILLINLPIGIAAASGGWMLLSDRLREERRRTFDLAGAITVTGGLSALVYGIVNTSTYGWLSVRTLPALVAAVVLLALFVVVERRSSAPLIPLHVFSSRRLMAANASVACLGAAMFGMWYFASFYLQDVLHLKPLGAGLAFLPMALTIIASATIAGRLVSRVGPGRVLATGLSLVSAGLLLFATVRASGGYVSDFVLPGLLVSSGIGASFVSAAIAAVSGVQPQMAGLASALVNTSRQMGGALGLAILASAAATLTRHLIKVDYSAPIVALTDGFRVAFLIGSFFAACGAACAFLFLVRPSQRPAQPPGHPGIGGPVGGPGESEPGPLRSATR